MMRRSLMCNNFKGVDVMDYAFDLQTSDMLATYYVDPFWEGIQW